MFPHHLTGVWDYQVSTSCWMQWSSPRLTGYRNAEFSDSFLGHTVYQSSSSEEPLEINLVLTWKLVQHLFEDWEWNTECKLHPNWVVQDNGDSHGLTTTEWTEPLQRFAYKSIMMCLVLSWSTTSTRHPCAEVWRVLRFQFLWHHRHKR